MPVASAAPRMPSSGNGPIPKIISGSRMMFATHPSKSAAIVTFMRPTAWKIFSKARLREITIEKENAT